MVCSVNLLPALCFYTITILNSHHPDVFRAVANRALIGGVGIFIFSCFARLISFEIKLTSI